MHWFFLFLLPFNILSSIFRGVFCWHLDRSSPRGLTSLYLYHQSADFLAMLEDNAEAAAISEHFILNTCLVLRCPPPAFVSQVLSWLHFTRLQTSCLCKSLSLPDSQSLNTIFPGQLLHFFLPKTARSILLFIYGVNIISFIFLCQTHRFFIIAWHEAEKIALII